MEEAGSGQQILIRVAGLAILRAPYRGTEVLVDFADHLCRGMCSSVVIVTGGGRGLVALPTWVLAVQAEEWIDAGCFRCLVVGRKFGKRQPRRPIAL